MTGEFLTGITAEALDEVSRLVLDENDRIKLLPAAVWREIPHDLLRAWCNVRRAIYNIPTVELVEWLRPWIAGKNAIEVASGNGDLSYHLGIPGTDSYLQCRNKRVFLKMISCLQRPTIPRQDIEQLDAEKAVISKKPQVVVASWLTERWFPGMDHGNEHGPREEVILEHCDTYIHIGNDNTHTDKRICKREHQRHYADWIVSRAADQSKNCIYIWQNR